MKLIYKYNLQFSVLLFSALFILVWPLYQYIFDVDGVGYGMVARRLAAGDFANAVNGYWSPLHSWLIFPFLKLGLSEVIAFKLSNGFLSVATLFIINSLLKKVELNVKQRSAILFTSVILLLHYSYYELAADLLLVPLFLLYVNLVFSKNFFQSLKLQLQAALIAALCYFAKTYAFPLLILLHLTLSLHNWYANGKLQWKSLLLFYLVFLLCCFPWMIALYTKYHFLTIGTSGKLNWTWYLGGVVHTENFFHLPVYNNSTSWWEDPYYASNNSFTMFSSFSLFLHQFRVVAFNTVALLKTYAEISIFSSAIVVWLLFKSRKPENTLWQKLLVITLLFPIGYLLNHIETRFFWVFGFLFLIAGSVALKELFSKTDSKQPLKLLVATLFYFSFLIQPINYLKDSANTGKEVIQLAEHFKRNSFHGSFASNTKQGECEVAAFLSDSKFYFRAKENYTYNELITKMQNNKISTYLFFYTYSYERESAIAAMSSAFRFSQPLPGLLIFSYIQKKE